MNFDLHKTYSYFTIDNILLLCHSNAFEILIIILSLYPLLADSTLTEISSWQ